MYRGREVAVKVLRIYSTYDLKGLESVSDRCRLNVPGHIGVLNMRFAEILGGSYTLEIFQSSECAVTSRSGRDRASICHGV